MPKPRTGYFIGVTESIIMADLTNTGSSSEREQQLRKFGITPAGYIKSSSKGKMLLRPFYDPDDITESSVQKVRKAEKIDRLNKLLEQAEKLKQEISES